MHMCSLQRPRAASARRRGEHSAHAGARARVLLPARPARGARARRQLRAGRRGSHTHTHYLSLSLCSMILNA